MEPGRNDERDAVVRGQLQRLLEHAHHAGACRLLASVSKGLLDLGGVNPRCRRFALCLALRCLRHVALDCRKLVVGERAVLGERIRERLGEFVALAGLHDQPLPCGVVITLPLVDLRKQLLRLVLCAGSRRDARLGAALRRGLVDVLASALAVRSRGRGRDRPKR